MKVILKHLGYIPATRMHCYFILCENGHADKMYDPTYTNAKEMEMDDKLWSENSGWADLYCDYCGHIYRERCYPGMVIACPACQNPELIPEDAILEEDNL